MNAPLLMLAWKEYRERRIQLLLCLSWILAGTLYAIAYERSHQFQAALASFHATAMLFGLCAPIFVAMRTSLGEFTDRTRAFSDGLAIAASVRGWVRLVGGAVVLILPLVAGAALLSLCFGAGWIVQGTERVAIELVNPRIPEREALSAVQAIALTWKVVAVAICSTSAIYVLLALLGTCVRTEAHAGYVGAFFVIVWFLLTQTRLDLHIAGAVWAADWIGALLPQALIVNFSYEVESGRYGDLDIGRRALAAAGLNGLLQFLLGWIFARRYAGLSREASQGKGYRATVGLGARKWIPSLFPLGTPALSLTWLAGRQALPMCLPGLAIACLFSLYSGSGEASQFVDRLPSSLWFLGSIWAIVVGTGLFASEVDPRVGEFWRTRPIQPAKLFAIKFAVGLLIVLLVLDGFAIAAAWNSPNWGSYHAMNWPYVAIMVPLHAAIFAVAVACACLVRRAAIGGLLTVAMLIVAGVAMQWFPAADPIELYNYSRFTDLAMAPKPSGALLPPAYPAVMLGMGTIAVAAIVAGWLSLRRYRPLLGGT